MKDQPTSFRGLQNYTTLKPILMNLVSVVVLEVYRITLLSNHEGEEI